MFGDGCGTTGSTIQGSNTFHDLALQTSMAKQVIFTSGETTTVVGTLTLVGASGQLLAVRSTIDGSEAFLDLAQAATGSFVDVKDVHAVGMPVTLAPGSIISGNASGWSIAGSVPALGMGSAALLVLSLFGVALRVASRAVRGNTAAD